MKIGMQQRRSRSAHRLYVDLITPTDLTADAQNPRGIRGYSLLGGGDFTSWKVTGNYRGEDAPDHVRGPMNEGGLWFEREGMCLVP